MDGAFEVGFNKLIATQLDLGTHKFGGTNFSGNSIALHGILHSSETLSFGAFVGRDSLESADREFAGLEVGFEADSFDIEGYYLNKIDNQESFDVLGVSGNYHLSDTFALTGSLESGDIGSSFSMKRYALGMRYMVSTGVTLTADIGASEAESFGVRGSETFVGVGAEFTFGAARGATFGKRSLFEVIPGL